MNARLVIRYLGFFVLAVGLFMLPSVGWALWFREWSACVAFLASAATSGVVGLICLLVARGADLVFRQREALGLVSLSYFAVTLVGALPYLFAGVLGPVDAYFETVSGFTTTGSTVLQDIEAAPKSLLFWRSLTQWLGGMGIVVLFIAVLPYLGAGGKMLFKSESPGPDPRSLSPQIKDTATALYKIYLGMTVIVTAALMLAGMSFYDALGHTFTTVATGGFSSNQASIGGFDSVAIEVIIIVFMIVGGTNFAILFAVMRGDWRAFIRSPEWRVYIATISIATILVTANLMYGEFNSGTGDASAGNYSAGEALRSASFQVVSITTTTGYTTDDFDAWPHFSRIMLLVLMFVGGCGGSTSGGIKVVRWMMLSKIAFWQLEGTFRPKTIRAVRVGEDVIDVEVQRMVQGFIIIFLLWLAGGTLFMSALGLPFETAASSVISALNNIGPGLHLVGASRDFSAIPDIGKLFLSLCMILGRLELFSVTVLFMPSFWKHS